MKPIQMHNQNIRPSPDTHTPEFQCLAWSYDQERPIYAKVPTITLQSNWTDMLDPDERPLTNPNKPPDDKLFLKHFGTSINMVAEVKQGSTFTNMKIHLPLIYRRGLNQTTLFNAHNILITSIIKFNPLAKQIPPTDANNFDKHVNNTYAHRYGYASHDPKHALYLPPPCAAKASAPHPSPA